MDICTAKGLVFTYHVNLEKRDELLWLELCPLPRSPRPTSLSPDTDYAHGANPYREISPRAPLFFLELDDLAHLLLQIMTLTSLTMGYPVVTRTRLNAEAQILHKLRTAQDVARCDPGSHVTS